MQLCNWDEPGKGVLLPACSAGIRVILSRADQDTERSGFALITEQGALRLEDGADFFIGNRDL